MSFKSCSNKGFYLTFANGWTVSVQFGWGNYCEHHDDYPDDLRYTRAGAESVDAEVACWPRSGSCAPLPGGDSVAGWCSTAEVLALMNAVAALPETATELPNGAWVRESER